MKLNLGCKNHKLEGFINIDISPKFSPDVVADVRRLNYKEVEVIYAGHLIEHFDCIETPDILENWIGSLKTGGKLILSFPDFEKVTGLWLSTLIGINHINKYIFANEVGAYQTHKQVVSLSTLQEYYPFEEITNCPYVKGGDMNWQSVVRFIKK